MTRLDASNEPSMEDILASIRKIIAEDPPGSRPAPPAAPRVPAAVQAAQNHPDIQSSAAQYSAAQMPAPQAFVPQSLTHQETAFKDTTFKDTAFQDKLFSHTPVREPAFESRPVAEVEAPVPQEPYLKATPVKSAPASFIPPSATFFPKEQPPSAARIEPSFAAMSRPVEQPVAAPLSVDAQLSDLLGDVIQPPSPRAAEPANLSNRIAEPVAPAADSAHKIEPQLPVAQQSEHRAGFTISRDGYVPAKSSTAVPPADVERDPFDFDLGPSPFEAKLSGKALDAPRPAEAMPAAFSEPVISEPVMDAGFAALARLTEAQPKIATESADPAVTRELNIETSAPVQAIVETDAVSNEALIVAAPAVEPPRAFFVAAPSVAATLAPQSAGVQPAAAIATPPAQMLEETVEKTVVQAGLPELPAVAVDVPWSPTNAIQDDANDDLAVIATGEPVYTSAPDAKPFAVVEHTMHMPVATGAAQRTMEDTVADLLRPMLRTWLAENMPRIVERALRREVSEQLHSEHKTAAE